MDRNERDALPGTPGDHTDIVELVFEDAVPLGIHVISHGNRPLRVVEIVQDSQAETVCIAAKMDPHKLVGALVVGVNGMKKSSQDRGEFYEQLKDPSRPKTIAFQLRPADSHVSNGRVIDTKEDEGLVELVFRQHRALGIMVKKKAGNRSLRVSCFPEKSQAAVVAKELSKDPRDFMGASIVAVNGRRYEDTEELYEALKNPARPKTILFKLDLSKAKVSPQNGHSQNVVFDTDPMCQLSSFVEDMEKMDVFQENNQSRDPSTMPILSAPPTPNLQDISLERALEAAALASPKINSSHSPESSFSDQSNTDEAHNRIQDTSIVLPSHESHYTDLKNLKILEEGGCLFSFVCNHELTPYEAEMVNSVINLSAFENETEENYVPHFEYGDHNNQDNEYTFLLARCAYLLAGVDVKRLVANPALLSTLEYQRACQPTGTTVWEDYENMEPDNFRITKPIIPYLYSFTAQFRVSGISDPDVLANLGRHVGTHVDGGILLERTKRSVPPKEDATKKTKSVLLFTDLGSDVWLVTHLTVILQQGLPDIIEKVIDTFGQWGLGETCDTALRTRRYLRRVFPLEEGGAEFLDAMASDDSEKLGEEESQEDQFYDVRESPSGDVDG